MHAGPKARTETTLTTAATNALYTSQPENREQKIQRQHSADASQNSFHRRSQNRRSWSRPSSDRVLLYIRNRLLQEVMMFQQHPPHFVQRISRPSLYRCQCRSRVWSASWVGTLPLLFRAGRRLYRSWTVHPYRFLHLDCRLVFVFSFCCCLLRFMTYPVFVLHLRFPPQL